MYSSKDNDVLRNGYIYIYIYIQNDKVCLQSNIIINIAFAHFTECNPINVIIIAESVSVYKDGPLLFLQGNQWVGHDSRDGQSCNIGTINKFIEFDRFYMGWATWA